MKNPLLSSLILITVAAFFASCSSPNSNSNSMEEATLLLDSSWQIFPSNQTDASGKTISLSTFYPKNCIKADVPTTVLNAQVENGIYTDIYVGENLLTIPDSTYRQAWWYRKTFEISPRDNFYELQFLGINYRANIWINGHQIADTTTVNNAFKQYRFDVSAVLEEAENSVAVEVFPPKAGDFSIGFVDWNPSPPDQNMGIFRPVLLNKIHNVQIINPYIESYFKDSDYTTAFENISFDLKNYASEPLHGEIQIALLDKIITKKVTIDAQSTKAFKFLATDYDALVIENPELWWPHTYGNPTCHELKISFTADETVLAKDEVTFGIREIADYYTPEGHRGFLINGEKISIRGAGWVDNLTLDNTKKYDEAQLQYVKDINLNTIRLEGFWGKDEHLYQQCDKLGILVMVGWSCHWEWENYLGKYCDETYGGILNEYDTKLMSDAWQDQIIWLRNHPSIIAWFGGSDCIPNPALEQLYLETFDQYDSSRVFLSSAKEWTTEVANSGVKMRGPYAYVPPIYWYADTLFGGAFGFNTETGPGAQVPPIESIKKMIPKENLWPIDSVWAFHCGRNEFNTLDRYTEALTHRYGKAHSVEAYAQKSQLLNYELMRPMFEAFSVNRYRATGVIQWMLNSAWPEMYWQLYDSYLMPNAAYFATKKSGEPLQAIYNYADNSIYLINDQLHEERDITVETSVFDLNSTLISHEEITCMIDKNSALNVLDLPKNPARTTTYFVNLRVKKEGKEVASNFYWLSTKSDVLDYEAEVPNWYYHTPSKSYADFTDLNSMPKADVVSTVERKEENGETLFTIQLENRSDKIAFFIELQLKDSATGETILPVLWQENYLSLLPFEKRTIEARVENSYLKNRTAKLAISTYNSTKK